jgi:hypothetical protein
VKLPEKDRSAPVTAPKPEQETKKKLKAEQPRSLKEKTPEAPQSPAPPQVEMTKPTGPAGKGIKEPLTVKKAPVIPPAELPRALELQGKPKPAPIPTPEQDKKEEPQIGQRLAAKEQSAPVRKRELPQASEVILAP